MSIVLPRDSFTTLNPRDTTNSKKNDKAFRPASRMATAKDELCFHNDHRSKLTDDEKDYGRGSFAMCIEVPIVG